MIKYPEDLDWNQNPFTEENFTEFEQYLDAYENAIDTIAGKIVSMRSRAGVLGFSAYSRTKLERQGNMIVDSYHEWRGPSDPTGSIEFPISYVWNEKWEEKEREKIQKELDKKQQAEDNKKKQAAAYEASQLKALIERNPELAQRLVDDSRP